MRKLIITVELTVAQVEYLKFLEENDIQFEPEYLSRNEANKHFGAGNVNRWIKQRKELTYKRPGVTQLSLAKSRKAAANRQDYLEDPKALNLQN